MSYCFIDGAGGVWPAEAATDTGRFGLTRRRDDVIQAIERGFIFGKFGERAARLALRPCFVSGRSLSRLYSLIGRRRPERVAITCDAHLSSWELVYGADRSIVRIELLVAEARHPSPRPLVTTVRLPLNRCLDLAEGRLFPVLQAWWERQGRWEPDFYGRLHEWGLLRDTIVSERLRASERLVTRHWGANITTYGNDWIRVAAGRDVEDVPNAEIGLRRREMLRETIAEGRPHLSAVAGLLGGAGHQLTRVQFHRLCMPWWTSDGAVFTTGFQIERRMEILQPASATWLPGADPVTTGSSRPG